MVRTFFFQGLINRRHTILALREFLNIRLRIAPSAFLNNLIDFYNNMLNFIKVAQSIGTFDDTISAEEATEYLFMIIRTLIYEWSQTRHHHKDIWLCGKYLPRILKTFVKE